MKAIQRSLALAVVLLMAMGSLALAEEKAVTVTGEGVIFHNDKAAAKDKAVDDALRKAVEQVAGTYVQSSTLVENFITVEDKILARAKGFVKTWKMLKEKEMDGVMVVTLSATVSTDMLKSELDAIQWATSQKENPRVMFLIAEQNVGQPMPKGWWTGGGGGGIVSMGSVENTLMQEFQNFGFEVVDPGVLAGKLTEQKAYTVTGQGTSNEAAREIGNLAEAQVVVVGSAVATIAGPVMQGSKLLSGQADLSVRVVNTDNGMVVATDTVHAADAHINQVTAGNRALMKGAKKLAANLQKKIAEKWSQTAETVTMEVSGLKDYQMVVSLKNILKNEVRGVKGVRQRRMSKDKASFDLYLKGKTQDLAAELTGKKLDLKFTMQSVTPNKLVFTVSK